MMKRTLVFALLALATLASAHGFVTDDEDGDSNNSLYQDSDSSNPIDRDDLKMVGGDMVQANDNMFTFELQIKPVRNTIQVARDQPPVCTGALLSTGGTNPSLFALTSARCVLSGDILYISAGGTSNSSRTAVHEPGITVDNAIIHEDFLRDMQTSDIALVPIPQTTSINPTTSSVITAARLPSIAQATSSFITQGVTMAGWGYPNDVFLANAPTLRQLTSWIVPNWYCAARHLGLPIRNTHICTAGLPNKGPCTGDAGAPLVLRSRDNTGTLIGLATYTPNRGCSRGRPGVFTRITSFLNWISENTGIDLDNQSS